MKKQKNVLICLEQLGIGGVETFSISQVNEFTRNNYKCYVIAKKGILYDKICNNKNVIFIDFEFTLDKYIDYKKVEYLEEKLKGISFEFAIIHQFPCILYMLPIIYKYKLPYISYLHGIVPGSCQWFMNTYPIFKVLFLIFFKNASKIIAITDDVKEENSSLFGISKQKYIVVNNSFDFNEISNYAPKKIKMPFSNFLLVSRFSSEKRTSILSAINFYTYYRDSYNDKARLTVLGDGDIFNEISNEYGSSDIVFKGAVSDVFSEMSKSDVVLGVDRCILEAVSLQRVAVICGYDGNISFVTPKLISKASRVNFCGKNLEDNSSEFFSMSQEKINSILSENYDFAIKNLSINVDIFSDMSKYVFEFDTDFEKLFIYLNEFCCQIEKLTGEVAHYYNDGQRLYSIIDKKDEQIEELNKQIEFLKSKTIKGIIKGIFRK